jgi:hypothetical protein
MNRPRTTLADRARASVLALITFGSIAMRRAIRPNQTRICTHTLAKLLGDIVFLQNMALELVCHMKRVTDYEVGRLSGNAVTDAKISGIGEKSARKQNLTELSI